MRRSFFVQMKRKKKVFTRYDARSYVKKDMMIPDVYTGIAEQALMKQHEIQTLELPVGMTEIGDYAFEF